MENKTRKNKKVYSAPSLTVFGQVQTVTQGSGGTGGDMMSQIMAAGGS